MPRKVKRKVAPKKAKESIEVTEDISEEVPEAKLAKEEEDQNNGTSDIVENEEKSDAEKSDAEKSDEEKSDEEKSDEEKDIPESNENLNGVQKEEDAPKAKGLPGRKKKKPKKQEFEVGQIIDMEINGKWKCPIRFLVRWVGFTETDDSWVSLVNLECDKLREDFLEISGRKGEYTKAYDKFMKGTPLDPLFEGYSKSLRKIAAVVYEEEDESNDELEFSSRTRTRTTREPEKFDGSQFEVKRKQRSALKAPSGGNSVSRAQANRQQAGREYEVLKVVGVREHFNKTQYKIRWKGLNANQDSWVAEEDVNCPNLVKEYLRGLTKKTIKEDSEEEEEEEEDEEEDDEPNYEVASIIDRKVDGSKVLYKVRWRGFSAKHDSWIPSQEMNCPEMVKKFESALSKVTVKQDWVVETIKDRRTKGGKTQYRVGWYGFDSKSDTWEPEENLSNCQDKVDKYLADLDDSKGPDESDEATSEEEVVKPKRKKARVSTKSPKKTTSKRLSGRNVSNVSYADGDDSDASYDP